MSEWQKDTITLLKEKLDLNQRQVQSALAIVGEANVPPDESMQYFGDDGERLQMMLNFPVNQRLFYALATGDLDPLIWALSESASALARFRLRVTSSYSFSSWSMVPSSVAIWAGHCASRMTRARAVPRTFACDHRSPWTAVQVRSNRSRFMTLPQAATKSRTNFCCASLLA